MHVPTLTPPPTGGCAAPGVFRYPQRHYQSQHLQSEPQLSPPRPKQAGPKPLTSPPGGGGPLIGHWSLLPAPPYSSRRAESQLLSFYPRPQLRLRGGAVQARLTSASQCQPKLAPGTTAHAQGSPWTTIPRRPCAAAAAKREVAQGPRCSWCRLDPIRSSKVITAVTAAVK